MSGAAAAMSHHDLRARVHKISGVAAVTGLTDIRAELVIAEDAFATGDVQTATSALQRAADAFPE
jgi:cytochrome c-type biogenesis protein CcmH/NrfG